MRPLTSSTRPDALRSDLEDRGLLKEIENDYVAGKEGLGVFGTPTFVFTNGQWHICGFCRRLHLKRQSPSGSTSCGTMPLAVSA